MRIVQGTPYEHIRLDEQGSSVETDFCGDLSVRDEFHDQGVIDNGDGTISILTQVPGPEKTYGPDGKLQRMCNTHRKGWPRRVRSACIPQSGDTFGDGGRRAMRRFIGRPHATASVLVACIAFVIAGLPGGASAQQAQQYTLSAVVGQPFTGTGRSVDPLDGSCTNVRDMTIDWDDGSISGATSFAIADDAVDIGGTPIPIRWVDVSGTHTFALPRDYDVLVNFTATCENANHELYDTFETNRPLFKVRVMASGTAPPTSCPFPGLAGISRSQQTTSFVQISQTGSCDVPPPCGRTGTVSDECLYTREQKKQFRALAKIAHDGYVVDKAIDDVISIPEDFITDKLTGKGLVTEFVVAKFWGKYVEDKILPKIPSFGKLPGFKRVPYDAILDAAKYASWLDYSKYWVLSRLADDPPDPNFTSLAKPPALRGIPHSVPALGDAKAREVALYVALLTTVERAAGARAAGDTNAAAVQLRHASRLSNRLVTLLGTRQLALKKAAKVVDQMPALRLPRGLVKRAARRLDTPASARFERKVLAKLGFTTERIKSVGDAAPDVSINHLTKPFEKVLGLEAEAKVIARERAALATFANKYATGGP